jgi:hypothetical protein
MFSLLEKKIQNMYIGFQPGLLNKKNNIIYEKIVLSL